ncbi:hypothetical protein ACJX0J_028011, partial [Zea mays]
LTEVVKANDKMLIAAGNFVISFYKHNTFHESQTDFTLPSIVTAGQMNRVVIDHANNRTMALTELLESARLTIIVPPMQRSTLISFNH